MTKDQVRKLLTDELLAHVPDVNSITPMDIAISMTHIVDVLDAIGAVSFSDDNFVLHPDGVIDVPKD